MKTPFISPNSMIRMVIMLFTLTMVLRVWAEGESDEYLKKVQLSLFCILPLAYYLRKLEDNTKNKK